jgi:pre-60S factor REI1
MINKQHTKLRYERGNWEEFDPFYDFERDNKEFMNSSDVKVASAKAENDEMQVDNNNENNEGDDDEDGWEDMSEDGDDDRMEEDNDDEADVYEGYEKEIARFGLDVTDLGELIFPDGRVVGHRALRRYYKQRVRRANTSVAVIAAQEAAGERLYEGRVININQHRHPLSKNLNEITGAGKGVLVPLSKEGAGGGPTQFSALSLYRYRAAVRKQRRGDEKGKRIREKTFQNINRMDKKANRLMNGVSVAHAAR